ncbi:asparagine synthase (glutamine-hydrolyzing) [Planococcus sp. N064]|uniref:asparagine synthase (glutamine-hydrolyzing) n=1 Tax=Planococcus liqunii TaxID=3058394 RepID=A0ABT8MU75_9BACL|nr:asparagine synthase (glutamine-hydrolyzing) [Planococcus sp. N064]MDN7228457.1 asparagine synthase (glutamine-hydrolyzing) [Planococcus sp. N064]
MCGFTGFIGETANTEAVLANMMNRIIHRGPDSSGEFIEGEAALGFRRLSIIGLETGGQPFYSENNNLVAMANGEIYNFIELRRELKSKGHVFNTDSDCEVILHGYEEYGEAIVSKLRGMFAFVIWDRNNKKLVAGRDMFGIKPLYYGKMNDTFFFGSEIKSFLPHPNFQKEFNQDALLPYLSFQYSVLEETFFKGIFKLPAAHYLVYEKGEARLQKYWAPDFQPKNRKLEQLVNEIDDTIQESILSHRISDVKVGSFLSSGVDSSYVASVLKPDKTFTVGFSDQNFSEIDNAKMLSAELEIQNKHAILDPDACFTQFEAIQYQMDEPHADPSIVPLYFLAELAKKDVTVILSGEGADEMFGGYEAYDMTSLMKKYRKLPGFVRTPAGRLASKLPDMRGKQFLMHAGLPVEEWFIGQANIFREAEAKYLVKEPYRHGPSVREIVAPYYEQVKDQDDLTKKQFLDMNLWLVGDILLKADKMSMAHSLEVRVPFLDKKVMAIAEQVPAKYRINKNETKHAMRLAARKALPEASAARKKIGFPVPIRNWIREERFYRQIKAYFTNADAASFFNVEEIMSLLNEHYEGKANNGRKIWTIFTFLVWYNRYFNLEEQAVAYDEPVLVGAMN